VIYCHRLFPVKISIRNATKDQAAAYQTLMFTQMILYQFCIHGCWPQTDERHIVFTQFRGAISCHSVTLQHSNYSRTASAEETVFYIFTNPTNE
jgi:hypothetical protein